MFQKIILLDDYKNALEKGIVSLSYKQVITESNMTDNLTYCFHTRNPEFIAYLTGLDADDVEYNLGQADSESFNPDSAVGVGVFNILSQKFETINFSEVTGEALAIASLTKPSETAKLVDARIYFGNKTGAISITEEFLQMVESKGDELNVLSLGFKEDEGAIVFDTVLAVDENMLGGEQVALKSIHLVKSQPANETE
jgi:hypothetical protein